MLVIARRRLSALGLFLLCGCAASGGRSPAHPKSAAAAARITLEDEYAAARPEFDALPLDAGDRSARRTALRDYLVAQITKALDRGHPEEAYDHFKQALTLYDAAELRGPVDDRDLAAVAARIEQAFRRRGAHEEVLTALAAERSLDPKDAGAAKRYGEVVAWLLSGTAGAGGDEGDPGAGKDGHERLREDLEAVVRLWPSELVVSQLSAIYLDHPKEEANLSVLRRARRGADFRELLSAGGRASAGYELARLYLRISRPQEALSAVKKLQSGDDPQVRALLEKLTGPSAQAGDAIAIAMYFAQQGRDPDVAERVCRDAAKRFPSAPEPHLCAGQLALALDRLVIALKNFEEAVRLEPTRWEAWEALAKVYNTRLFQLVSDENLNVGELEPQLKKVEAFHQEAQKRFPGRPLRPSLANAIFQVGRGYFNAGGLKDAVRFLERSVQSEPTAVALELYGQIRLKRGEAKEAAALFERAANLPKDEKVEQLYWRAKLRRELADALEGAGDTAGAAEARRNALADWDVLSGIGLTPDGLAESGIERAKLLYQLGDRDASIRSFEKAIDAVPDRGSTYADVIAFLVPRGELEEALDAYHRALGRNEVTEYLKVYCSLWILDLARRAGQPDDPLATAFLKSTDGGKWYDDLARWATGRESEATLVSRADSPAKKAEAAFYRAMRSLDDGKVDEARGLWKQVLDTDMMAFFEYDMAATYLKLGNAPAQPVLRSRPHDRATPTSAPRPPDGSI